MIARTALGKILVFSVFFLGIATGALVDRAYRSRIAVPEQTAAPRRDEPRLSPQERAKRDQDRMAEFLGLDQPQRDQIQKILESTREEFKELRGKTDPEFQALREKTEPLFKAIQDGSRAKIRAVLRADQQKKVDEFWAKRDNGGRGRPPRPGDRQDKSDKSDNKPAGNK